MTIVALVLLPVLLATPMGPTDLSGAWTFQWKPDFGGQHPNSHECQIAQQGSVLTIRCDEQTMKGKVKGKTVTFQHTTGLRNELTATYKVTLDDDGRGMTGSWHLSSPENKSGRFEAHKR
jgi:hypothetical protein